MTDLREKVAEQIYIATSLNSKAKGNEDHLAAVFGPNRRSGYEQQGNRARQAADAAIAAVLEALKEPSVKMRAAGISAPDYLDCSNVWTAMLTAFTRDHYLSALAEEDGREL